MNADITKLAPIFGENQRPAKAVTLEALKGAGMAFVSYGIKPGETITFPTREQHQLRAQETRVGSTAKQYLINCIREENGVAKSSWVAIGSLCRADINGKGANPFADEMIAITDHMERVQHLFGKKVKGIGTAELNVQEWKDGQITERGKTVKQTVTVIEEVK